MRLHALVLGMTALVCVAGCNQSKTPAATTAQDVEATKQEAQHEVDQARAEASKDVKSAAKLMGPASKGVTEAKVEGSYDVAMAKADGDHKVATEQCLTLQAAQQQSCKDQADATYETAKAAAKASRVAREQG